MKLSDYLKANSLSRAEFAEQIGVSSEAVRRYLAGTRIPDKQAMEKIALATGCEVTANDFFGISVRRGEPSPCPATPSDKAA